MKFAILGDNTYQKNQLDLAVRNSGNELLSLDSERLLYYLNNDGDPIVYNFNGQVQELPDVLIVRNANSGRKLANSIFRGAGVDVVDPDDRFTFPWVKITSAIRQFQNGFVVPSYLSLSKRSVYNNIPNMIFPLVWKDHNGSHSRGLEYIPNADHLRNWLDGNNKNIYFFQRFFELNEEWRFIMINGHLINSARKVLKIDQTKFSGRRFVAGTPDRELLDYANRYAREGLVGIDIARARHEHRILIFEQNRAPEWESVDEKTESNTAELIISYLE